MLESPVKQPSLFDHASTTLESGLRWQLWWVPTAMSVIAVVTESPVKCGQLAMSCQFALTNQPVRVRSQLYECDETCVAKSSKIALACRQFASPGLQMKFNASRSLPALEKAGIATRTRSPYDPLPSRIRQSISLFLTSSTSVVTIELRT